MGSGCLSVQDYRRDAPNLHFHFAPKLDKMPTNAKDTKRLSKALFDAVGLLSFLFGSLILLTTVFGAIGNIFTSTKPLFQFRRVKKNKDNSHNDPDGGYTRR